MSISWKTLSLKCKGDPCNSPKRRFHGPRHNVPDQIPGECKLRDVIATLESPLASHRGTSRGPFFAAPVESIIACNDSGCQFPYFSFSIS
jgi:hypothetical protein